MRRSIRGKPVLLLFGLAFALFYGMDMAKNGMERVQGPPDVNGASRVAGAVQGAAAQAPINSTGVRSPSTSEASAVQDGTVKNGSGWKQAGQTAGQDGKQKALPEKTLPDVEVRESFVNHASNRIGDALRLGAKAAIGLVVSIFDSIAR